MSINFDALAAKVAQHFMESHDHDMDEIRQGNHKMNIFVSAKDAEIIHSCVTEACQIYIELAKLDQPFTINLNGPVHFGWEVAARTEHCHSILVETQKELSVKFPASKDSAKKNLIDIINEDVRDICDDGLDLFEFNKEEFKKEIDALVKKQIKTLAAKHNLSIECKISLKFDSEHFIRCFREVFAINAKDKISVFDSLFDPEVKVEIKPNGKTTLSKAFIKRMVEWLQHRINYSSQIYKILPSDFQVSFIESLNKMIALRKKWKKHKYYFNLSQMLWYLVVNKQQLAVADEE